MPRASLQPQFHLGDAHQLPFPDARFDVVFGGSILHHLDFPRALDEIYRVLRPGGRIVFREPLNINPAAKLVRALTPKARTPDEHALRRADLRMISERFQTSHYYAQLLAVPAGILSYLLFKRPNNPLNFAAFRADCTLLRLMPWLGPYCRLVLVLGTKRERR